MATAPAIGIDLGTTKLCVGVYQNGKFEVIPNEYGERSTPAYVTFTKTEYLIGTDAKNHADMNPAETNTIYDVNRLIGRKFDDPALQNDMKHWPFTVKDVDNKPKIEVQYKGETKQYFPEEIVTMLLNKVKRMAEAYLGKTVSNAVITAPNTFNYHQREAIKNAGIEAGLNPFRILSSSTAAGLTYGFDKEIPGERNVLIFDLGKQYNVETENQLID